MFLTGSQVLLIIGQVGNHRYESSFMRRQAKIIQCVKKVIGPEERWHMSRKQRKKQELSQCQSMSSDLRGDCIQKSGRLPTPPGSCLPAAYSGHSHWFKQQPSLTPIQPMAGQGIHCLLYWTPLYFSDLAGKLSQQKNVELIGNNHITTIRKRNAIIYKTVVTI